MDITFTHSKFMIGKLVLPGIATVGYTFYNADGAIMLPRSMASIVDLGSGDYGALIEFPAEIFTVGFSGYIQWDDGVSGPVFNESINITSDLKEFILMLFERNIEFEFIVASVADNSRNVKVGMYDGMMIRHKFDSAPTFHNAAFSDYIKFYYKNSAFDSDIIKKTAVDSIDGYGAYGYDYGDSY